jgi:hypothetical protein
MNRDARGTGNETKKRNDADWLSKTGKILTHVGHLEIMTVASVASLRRCPTSSGIGAPLHRNTQESIDITEDDQLIAVCRKGKDRQRISLTDLPLPETLPEGGEWIVAYRYWRTETA